MKALIFLSVAMFALTGPAGAATARPVMSAPAAVTRTYAMPDAPIAGVAIVPPGYSTVYVSGMGPGVTHPEAEKDSIASFGTTEEQTESALARIQAALKAQGLDFKDVVSMRVYLVGDPANGGRMDFAGMMKAYSRHFGTMDQPNRPTRTTVQVAALRASGFLVEIECVAVKPAG
jgi:enamine deaminase RidA (YjgF/YER057c/UK114 family)